MKKKSLLLTAMVTFAMTVAILLPTQTMAQNVPSYVPTNGLVGWWPFTGNAIDSSGNGYNGTVSGATLTSDRFGSTNSAYSFIGTQSINCGTSSALGLTTQSMLTISFWTKSLSSSYPYISKYQDLVPANCNYFIGSATSNQVNTIRVTGNGQNNRDYQVTANQWNHVVVIFNGFADSASVYVNGAFVSIDYFIYAAQVSSQAMIFGARPSTTYPLPNGFLDDIGIWNRALTQQEVTALYNACSNVTATISPSGNTTFCQGNSVTLTASAGNSYNWSNGASSQSITVNQGNTYAVTVTDANNCTASASQAVTVNSNPSVSFSLPTSVSTTAPTFSMNGNPSGGTYTGAGVSGSSFNPSAAGLGLKQVNYTYSNVNGCSGSASSTTLVYDTTGNVCTSYDTLVIYETVYDTVTTTVNDTVTTYLSVTDTLKIDVNLTGINPPNNSNLVTVYPNPAKDHLLINCGNYISMNGYTMKITNTLGQIVFNQPVTQQQFYIDLSTWGGAGTYILYITDPNQTVKSQKQIVLQ